MCILLTRGSGAPLGRRLLVLASIGLPLSAQRLAQVWVAPQPLARVRASVRQQIADSTRHDGSRAIGGLLGATAGFLAGGFGGQALEESSTQHCQDFCGLGGFVLGAMVGESFGMVGGMALAGPGTRAPDLLASLGMAAVGLGLAALTNEPLTLVAVPLVQLVALLSLDHSRTEAPAPD